jgi:hypothetical protein
LPLTKEVNSQKIYGVIFITHAITHNFTIKFANIFDVPESYVGYQALEGISYNTATAIVDDGWVVD